MGCREFVAGAQWQSGSPLPTGMRKRWQCWSRRLLTPPTLAQDVASRVQERTGILPAHVELLAPGTLPKTTSGKLRRREARIHWLAGTLSPPTKFTAMKLVLQAISGEVSHARASLSRLAANKRMVG
jgi:hypothetical protein